MCGPCRTGNYLVTLPYNRAKLKQQYLLHFHCLAMAEATRVYNNCGRPIFSRWGHVWDNHRGPPGTNFADNKGQEMHTFFSTAGVSCIVVSST